MIDDKELKEYFYYDETSPSCLRWKIDMYAGEYKTSKNVSCGDVAGARARCKTKSSGSWNTSLNGKKLKVHRIIYQMFHNDLKDGECIDHIDGNPWNNKIENLRKVDHKTNMRNVKMRDNNTSGVTGVEFYNRPHRSPYFHARWVDADGNTRTKSFAISVHGMEGAFMKAVGERNKALEEVGGYTNTHGWRK